MAYVLGQPDHFSINYFSLVQVLIDSTGIVNQKPSMNEKLKLALVDDCSSYRPVSQDTYAFICCFLV